MPTLRDRLRTDFNGNVEIWKSYSWFTLVLCMTVFVLLDAAFIVLAIRPSPAVATGKWLGAIGGAIFITFVVATIGRAILKKYHARNESKEL
jgi:hypothetical protein